MKLLLDTHVLLWAASEPEQLTPQARDGLEDGTNDVLVSVVSAWEIAIKQSLGKLAAAGWVFFRTIQGEPIALVRAAHKLQLPRKIRRHRKFSGNCLFFILMLHKRHHDADGASLEVHPIFFRAVASVEQAANGGSVQLRAARAAFCLAARS